jgi:hypothetical protein
LTAPTCDFRIAPINGHRQTGAVGPVRAKPGHQVAAGQSFNCYQAMAMIEGTLKFGEAEWNIGDDFSSMELPCS